MSKRKQGGGGANQGRIGAKRFKPDQDEGDGSSEAQVWQEPARSTVKVSNVGLESTNEALEELFADFGPIKRCFAVKPKKKTNRTIGFVQFLMAEDAAKAVSELGPSGAAARLDGRVLGLELVPDHQGQRDKNSSTAEDSKVEAQQFAKQRKARLIIRNLSFKADEDQLQKHFEKTGGKVTEVNILKKPDGKMVGCAFVQMDTIGNAAKAVSSLNGKPFLGRAVAVDWAVAKDKFQQASSKASVSVERVDEGKDSDEDDDEDDKDEDDEEGTDVEDQDDESEDKDEDDESEDSDDEDEDNESEDDDDERSSSRSSKKTAMKVGHDVGENKTVFVRNLSFDSDQGDLRQMMQEAFGKVLFAVMVVDKKTNHPKGTAFVKFEMEESAAKCVKASAGDEGLHLDGRRIYTMAALAKEEADSRQKSSGKETVKKDSRNLYLSREGLVREGTLAAEGVSKEDMAKRLQISRWKKQILQDLNMFVSPVRLCIRNLPPSVDDRKLKSLILKHGSKERTKPIGAMTECRVMRDLKKTDAPSRGYGFLTFADHESALEVLRQVNNNPTVFGPDRRPIIEFSIENRKALNARQKRLEKSRLNNPLCNKGLLLNSSNNPKGMHVSKGPGNDSSKDRKQQPGVEADKGKRLFMGAVNKPGSKNLPSHEGPKVRHVKRTSISRKDLKRREMEKKTKKGKGSRRAVVESNDNDASNASRAKANNGATRNPQRVEEASKAKKKKAKPMKKADIKDLRDEKKFSALVETYKKKLVNLDTIGTRSTRWFNA